MSQSTLQWPEKARSGCGWGNDTLESKNARKRQIKAKLKPLGITNFSGAVVRIAGLEPV
jgi:hypothetical protein